MEIARSSPQPRPLHTLRGHVRELTAVALSYELSLAASVSARYHLASGSVHFVAWRVERCLFLAAFRAQPMAACFFTRRTTALWSGVWCTPSSNPSVTCLSRQFTADL